ncbi:facilitated trehalose transporter Tret1-like [Anopheles albimanus]|uniref:Major facilitator superfamily (MFS) profile domain-containing protein n=1 Tax=Anopheles albimanus TaxID=7167 RepID=A0A182FS13_ANOAL|nr:facilitated trehalose transporter Tret1-like [Anopheles albimanus]XP_035776351.1 facilitated trehalose transporter Tret1-like [Anopheles albimanus]
MGKTAYTINGTGASVQDEKKARHTMEEKPQPQQHHEVSTFRRILPQILASTAKNFLLLDLGMAVAFPTIVIPALRGIKNRSPDEFLHFTPQQASWFGSIAYICQPVGSVLSGIILEPLGRKRSMILVNIPHIIGWFMLHFAGSLEEMYTAAILLGLGVGFMEAPIVTYVGEICQPSIRGILTSCAGVAVMLGFFMVYLLGTVTTWRTTAAICASIPIATMIAICFVPETPMWLLSKHRHEDAQKSLQWLRGWVSPKAVEQEFQEMKRYSANSAKCATCQKADATTCQHPPLTEWMKLKELTRKRNLRPFVLVMLFFVFGQLSGLTGMRPYLVQIFQAYGVPLDANWATVSTGLLGLMANIVCMVSIKFVGKRKLALMSMTVTALSCIGLSIYAFNSLPAGWTSFDIHADTSHVSSKGYIPMVLFFMLAFFTSVGVLPVPWILLSEVFPFRNRSLACGITAALHYVMSFVTTKTYFNLESSLSLPGVILFYGVMGLIGTFFVYFFLPETEKRTLEDIEVYFSDNKRKLTDIHIPRRHKDVESVAVVSVLAEKEKEKHGIDNTAFTEGDK